MGRPKGSTNKKATKAVDIPTFDLANIGVGFEEEMRSEFIERVAVELLGRLYGSEAASTVYKKDDVPAICVDRATKLADLLKKA